MSDNLETDKYVNFDEKNVEEPQNAGSPSNADTLVKTPLDKESPSTKKPITQKTKNEVSPLNEKNSFSFSLDV
jgi:hypothetical protein